MPEDVPDRLTAQTIEHHAEGSGWLDAYYDLRNGTWLDDEGNERKLTWKQAAFVAWDSAPKGIRKPKTMKELAAVLGYKNEHVFYKWRKREWYRKLVIELREGILLPYLRDVDEKTIEAARREDGSAGVAARKLFYEQLGLSKQNVNIEIEHNIPIRVIELADDDDREE